MQSPTELQQLTPYNQPFAHALCTNTNQRWNNPRTQQLSRSCTLEKCGKSLPQKCRDGEQFSERPYRCDDSFVTRSLCGRRCAAPAHACPPAPLTNVALGEDICSHKDKEVLFVLGMLLNQTKSLLFSL